jgi:hypothetical protein
VTVTGKAAALADGLADGAMDGDALGGVLGAVGATVSPGDAAVPEQAATTRARTATLAGRRRARAPARDRASNGVLLRAGEEDDGARDDTPWAGRTLDQPVGFTVAYPFLSKETTARDRRPDSRLGRSP